MLGFQGIQAASCKWGFLSQNFHMRFYNKIQNVQAEDGIFYTYELSYQICILFSQSHYIKKPCFL